MRSDYFCLFEHENYGGLQWVFAYGAKVRLSDIGAANVVSSGANATPVGAWLYWNDDYSGWNWNVPANRGTPLSRAEPRT